MFLLGLARLKLKVFHSTLGYAAISKYAFARFFEGFPAADTRLFWRIEPAIVCRVVVLWNKLLDSFNTGPSTSSRVNGGEGVHVRQR